MRQRTRNEQLVDYLYWESECKLLHLITYTRHRVFSARCNSKYKLPCSANLSDLCTL